MERIDEVRRRLDVDLPRLAVAHGVPGVSVAVFTGGEVVEATTGVVNLRTGVPVTPDTLFMIQSITKVWTAALTMQLVDEGLISLDAPVRTYLPAFRTADEGVSARITVRHLLTHAGGFEGDIWAPTTCGTDALERFVDDLVSRAPQYAAPGEMYSYCSAGYGVLGRLVEVLRGAPYADALRRHLAVPLGIDELAFSADEALGFRAAIGHVGGDTGSPLRPCRVWAAMPPSNPAAGNQLAMSARGLLAFGRMHLSDGRAADGTPVLSDRSLRAMREWQIDHPAAAGDRTGHGLGWMLRDQGRTVEHAGDSYGVAALLRIVPDRGLAVAVAGNGGSFADLVSDLIGDIAGVTPAAPPPTAEAVPDPRRYVGRYQTRVARHDVILDGSGRLRLTDSALNEAVTVARAAGASVTPQESWLRHIAGDAFAVTDRSGRVVGAAEFLGVGGSGRAQFLHTGRAAPRVG